MITEDARDAVAADPALAALERSETRAFAVDGSGGIVWTNAAGRPLTAVLDAAARRALARIAAGGAEGTARIAIGDHAIGAVAFRSRRVRLGAGRATLFEALTPVDLPDPVDAAHPGPDAPRDGNARDRAAAPVMGSAPADGAVPPDAPAAGRRAPSGRAAHELRFVFEMDADGAISFLSPDLGDVVGPSAAAALGRPWTEVAVELGLDPAGAVADRIRRPGVWSDVRIDWPCAAGGRLPILLSALPMFDRGRTFIGFRGLGRAIEDELDAPAGSDAQPAVAEDAAPGPGPAIEPLRNGAAPEAPAIDNAASDEEPGLLFEPVAIISAPWPMETFHSNVVPLREAAPRSALSTVEEDAFDEIARRLRGVGVRTAPDPAQHAIPAGPETAELVIARSDGVWTIDDVEGRAPTTSRVDDVLRLLDRLPIGALVLRAGDVAHANRAALEMTGCATIAMLAERGIADLFAVSLPRDDAAPSTIRLVAHDGVEVEVEARLSAISWAGAPATLVSMKRAEGVHAALRREKDVAEILDTATDGVLTLDGAGRILSANRSAEALFGFEAAEVIGRPFTLSLAPESRRTAFDYLDGLRSNGVAAVMNDGREVLGLARHGGAIPLYLTIGRIGAADDVRYCAVMRDITHWKKAEEELLAAKRQAERANAQKSEFLSRVGHEIRTPLNAIIGFAELMMEERLGPLGNARYRDYVRDIHDSGAHLVGLVGDLLDLSQVESGALKLNFSHVDLNEVASQAAALLQPQANREHVIIRTSLARNLPAVMADRRTLRQVMANLVGGAVKSSRAGAQVIVATAYTDAGQVVVRVRDSGPGLSKKELARAMEPFRPLAPEDGDAGVGVGLPLTKALAEANEAAFAVQSEIGQGTLVEVTFPAMRVLAN